MSKVRFAEFLESIPECDRSFYLLMRMYEKSCDDDQMEIFSAMIEEHITENYLTYEDDSDDESEEESGSEKEVFPEELKIELTPIQKLDKEFDEKLGKWVDTDSDSSDDENNDRGTD